MNKHWKSEKFSHTWTAEQRKLQNWEDEAIRQEVEWYRQKYLEAVFKANQLNLPLEFNHDPVPQRREESPRAEADAGIRAERAAEPPAQHVYAHDPDGSTANDNGSYLGVLGKPAGKCCYDLAWRGPCGEATDLARDGRFFCRTHYDVPCQGIGCNNRAVKECCHTGQFVCGMPLCHDCHGYEVKGESGTWGFASHRHGRAVQAQ